MRLTQIEASPAHQLWWVFLCQKGNPTSLMPSPFVGRLRHVVVVLALVALIFTSLATILDRADSMLGSALSIRKRIQKSGEMVAPSSRKLPGGVNHMKRSNRGQDAAT